MTIYECDMCGRQFRAESDVHEILVHESETPLPFGDGERRLQVCKRCSRRIYDYIRRFRDGVGSCTVDTFTNDAEHPIPTNAAINEIADALEGRAGTTIPAAPSR